MAPIFAKETAPKTASVPSLVQTCSGLRTDISVLSLRTASQISINEICILYCFLDFPCQFTATNSHQEVSTSIVDCFIKTERNKQQTNKKKQTQNQTKQKTTKTTQNKTRPTSPAPSPRVNHADVSL